MSTNSKQLFVNLITSIQLPQDHKKSTIDAIFDKILETESDFAEYYNKMSLADTQIDFTINHVLETTVDKGELQEMFSAIQTDWLDKQIIAGVNRGMTPDSSKLGTYKGTFQTYIKDQQIQFEFHMAALLWTTNAAKKKDTKKDSKDELFKAIENGDIETIRQLLDQINNINSRDFLGRTPLMLASRQGNFEIVQLLIERGADVNSKDSTLWTPLMYASKYAHSQIVDLLIRKNANLKAKNKSGKTALKLAQNKAIKKQIKVAIKNRIA